MKNLPALCLLLTLAAFFMPAQAAAGQIPAETPEEIFSDTQPLTAPEERESTHTEGEDEPEAVLDEWITETGATNVKKELHLMINGTEVRVDWEKNESVDALNSLVSSAPLTIQMSMYGGFEQVGPLGTALPRNDSRMTAQAGDIVLYSGNQMVIFYGSNSWTYTRLGKIADGSTPEFAEMLGNGDVTVTLVWE